jgi:DNA-directed RNA polymerase subunit M/transcription elongation factor TFIIS
MLTDKYQETYERVNNEYKSVNINNFSYDKEFIKKFKFVTLSNSDFKNIPIDLIKYAIKNINRQDIIDKFEKLINCLPISESIEMSIFEFSLNYIITNNYPSDDYEQIYMHTFNDIYDNLDVNNKQINNKTLLPNILDGNIPYHILAFMKMYQIHPDRWNYIINKNNLRDTTLQNVSTTDEFRCARCGERKHKYYIMQTRSADEPATIFYTCIICKKTFTKSM